MCSEASTILGAVAADFFFDCWYLEIPSDNRIQHLPMLLHYHAQEIGIIKPFTTMFQRTLLPRISHYIFRLLIKPSSGVSNI
jgi:hypothetical protein